MSAFLPIVLLATIGNIPPTTMQLVTPERIFVLKKQLDTQGGMGVQLTAYRRTDKRQLWQKQLYKNHGSFDVGFAGSLGPALLIKTGGGDVHWPDVTAFNLASGQTLWKVSGEILGRTGGQVLLISPGVGDPNQNEVPSRIPVIRAGGTGQSADQPLALSLQIPERPRCGPAQYQAEFPDLRFTNHDLYALRRDRCGTFIARFDWHANAQQKPMMYPDHRPVTHS